MGLSMVSVRHTTRVHGPEGTARSRRGLGGLGNGGLGNGGLDNGGLGNGGLDISSTARTCKARRPESRKDSTWHWYDARDHAVSQRLALV